MLPVTASPIPEQGRGFKDDAHLDRYIAAVLARTAGNPNARATYGRGTEANRKTALRRAQKASR